MNSFSGTSENNTKSHILLKTVSLLYILLQTAWVCLQPLLRIRYNDTK